ncbi:dynein light chain, Tctex-1 domain containing protein [Monocercomonoides exilis]|uniref:dynein light chain, Tctex-1 domain containing protein n=1 Tax=Monocercomonoides exilis TaxID=2049356 RepID=UPI00355AA02E|nr:dynein light chain, Tctex-1 domain containing protein [Monocercomonoides exilis]|eukprot:MONOS_11093.1-p1 / transcript=MONOS_11093.1 / gene=MONOS_11093 / organism=Monocercomonoides_exilis_PA203 / gene_product=dynein light chain, Tctex-1 domain containing protein / transcript_product=dynein light chain, Tctex-1 domain containing protein / location=Mono_scaffold00537:23613-24176(-) / protein_length=121 / sequence_SO=supercontig / SO=protein_coding / is_pseudo=false
MAEPAPHATKPRFQNRFKPSVVKELMRKVMIDKLDGQEYHSENTPSWSREISDDIRNQLKELDFDRYKYCVQVIIGEQKGEGIRFGFRALWDADTDDWAQEIYMNESLFCVAVVFGTYFYS